jgi:hypothetical protein
MFFATRDFYNGHIMENASIAAFETEPEARDYLLSGYSEDFDRATAVIESGSFGGCWIKARDLAATNTSPFAADELIVRVPGGHPGHHTYWIEPRPTVLVVTSIEEIED